MMEVADRELTRTDPFPQVLVVPVVEETVAQRHKSLDHAITQLIQRAGPGLGCGLTPAFHPARRLSDLRIERDQPRLVTHPVQHEEVGEDLAAEDRVQVELDVGRSPPTSTGLPPRVARRHRRHESTGMAARPGG